MRVGSRPREVTALVTTSARPTHRESNRRSDPLPVQAAACAFYLLADGDHKSKSVGGADHGSGGAADFPIAPRVVTILSRDRDPHSSIRIGVLYSEIACLKEVRRGAGGVSAAIA